jgi:hypothetical protein
MASTATDQDDRIREFWLTRPQFATYCEERGIRISENILAFYAKKKLLYPIAQTKRVFMYDPFQIYHVAKLENVRLRTLEAPRGSGSWRRALEMNREDLKKQFDAFAPIFETLQSVRYYYLPRITGVLTRRNQPPATEDWYKKWDEQSKTFDPKPIVEKLGLTSEQVNNWRTLLVLEAQQTDPFRFLDWHFLIDTIKRKHFQKYRLLRGSALLAQDFYVMAEMLTLVFEKIKGENEKVLPLTAIFDGTGGKWRNGICASCGETFTRRSREERYCPKCKKEIAATLKGGWHCEKCNALLYRYTDNNELLNNILPGTKKENQIQTYARLEYGLLTLVTTCKCGHKNIRQIEQGWWG